MYLFYKTVNTCDAIYIKLSSTFLVYGRKDYWDSRNISQWLSLNLNSPSQQGDLTQEQVLAPEVTAQQVFSQIFELHILKKSIIKTMPETTLFVIVHISLYTASIKWYATSLAMFSYIYFLLEPESGCKSDENMKT